MRLLCSGSPEPHGSGNSTIKRCNIVKVFKTPTQLRACKGFFTVFRHVSIHSQLLVYTQAASGLAPATLSVCQHNKSGRISPHAGSIQHPIDNHRRRAEGGVQVLGDQTLSEKDILAGVGDRWD